MITISIFQNSTVYFSPIFFSQPHGAGHTSADPEPIGYRKDSLKSEPRMIGREAERPRPIDVPVFRILSEITTTTLKDYSPRSLAIPS